MPETLFVTPDHGTLAGNMAQLLGRLERQTLALLNLDGRTVIEAEARIDAPLSMDTPPVFAHVCGSWLDTQRLRTDLLICLCQARHASRFAAAHLAMRLDSPEARDRFQSERRRCARLLRVLEKARKLALAQCRLARGPVGHNLATFEDPTASAPFPVRALSPWLDLEQPPAPRPRRF